MAAIIVRGFLQYPELTTAKKFDESSATEQPKFSTKVWVEVGSPSHQRFVAEAQAFAKEHKIDIPALDSGKKCWAPAPEKINGKDFIVLTLKSSLKPKLIDGSKNVLSDAQAINLLAPGAEANVMLNFFVPKSNKWGKQIRGSISAAQFVGAGVDLPGAVAVNLDEFEAIEADEPTADGFGF